MSANNKDIVNIFLDYASKDLDKAAIIAGALDLEGYNVYFEEIGIRGGENWIKERDKALEKCDYFVPLFSPRYIETSYTMQYFVKADRRKKQLSLF